MTKPESSRQSDVAEPGSDPAEALNADEDQYLLRIRRLGKQMFGVANCVISFGTTPPVAVDARQPSTVEAMFCHRLASAKEPIAVPDTHKHPVLSRHCEVTGSPAIRFFASHPVLNRDREQVGAISLVDYAPRTSFPE